jgi:rhodanese-related sulfurtransferase
VEQVDGIWLFIGYLYSLEDLSESSSSGCSGSRGIEFENRFPLFLHMPDITFHEITVTELALKLADLDRSGDRCCQLIDVREPQELAVATIPGFINLPLSEYGQWSTDIQQRLQPTVETIVLCHHGMRSAQMCAWLASQGFTNLYNVIGGIAAYSQIVDPSVPKY